MTANDKSIAAQLAADAAEDREALLESGDLLERISKLGRALVEEQLALAAAEETTKAINARIKDLAEKRIPDAMREARMTSFQLDDGTRIKLESHVYGSLTGARKEDALKWLRENGYTDIIKSEVGVSFAKGEDQQRTGLLELLNKAGFVATSAESVHSSTLKAWLKERRAAQEAIPDELFAAYDVTRAKVEV